MRPPPLPRRQGSRLLPALALLLPGLQGAPPPPDPGTLEPGVRRYDLLFEGRPVGSVTHHLVREGAEWVATMVVAPGGAAPPQVTTLRFDVSDLTPHSYELATGAGGVGGSGRLAVEEGRIVGRVDLPPALGGSRQVSRERGDLLFPGMEEYALALAPLEPETRIRYALYDLVTGQPAPYEARVGKPGPVETPAGRFEAFPLEVTGEDGTILLHLRAAPPHILLRQEYPDQPMVLVLAGVSPL